MIWTEIVVAVIIAVIGWIIIYVGWISKLADRLARLETKTDLFWKVVEEKVVDMIRSPTHYFKDLLLSKLQDGTIEEEEAKELRAILDTDFKEEVNNSPKCLAYVLVMARINTILYEFEFSKGKNNVLSKLACRHM